MIDLKKISSKWQKRWEDKDAFKAREDPDRKKFYCLEMFPYPSATLHIGHLRNYSIGDAFARFKRLQGFNVIYPMGYDAFGLPAENAAIKHKIDPEKWTFDNINSIRKQQKAMGLSYDWSREIITCTPEYYKWNQWIFLKLFEKGLAYKKEAPVNWCPKCNTVLANEQVKDGKCWRCSAEVEEKNLSQWFLKITDYADELLSGLDKLQHWPERVKTMQKNWIGKSHGIEIHFNLEDDSRVLPMYTTRPDTIFSVTFVVIAPEHPLVDELVKGTKYEKDVEAIRKKVKKQSIIERTTPEGKDKIGCFLGKHVINPANGEKVPVWIANFVVQDYGTGIVMADAHDQRDFEFARKYKIPLKFVISDDGSRINPEKATRAFISDGVLFDSGEFSGMDNQEAIPDMIDWLVKKKAGKRSVNYKLKDWLISRQRYWGTPIPIIHCESCGPQPATIPVILPKKVKFAKGNPLETAKDFVNAKCPKCGSHARRETDTMDTFVDSSWYFMRYCDPKNRTVPFGTAARYWMPVDQYIGGIEHAVMHLLYARFFTKALRDLGLIDIDEPFSRLLCQGMLIKDGQKMSKSVGNIVDPAEIYENYSVDTARLFILFASLPEKELEWNSEGVQGSHRFLNKVISLTEKKYDKGAIPKDITDQERFILSKLNSTIASVTDHLEGFELSLAAGKMMEFVNEVHKAELSPVVTFKCLETVSILLNPFAPHLSEELWEKLGNEGFSSRAEWPKPDKVDDSALYLKSFIDNTRKDIISVMELVKIDKPEEILLFIAPKWSYKAVKKLKSEMSKTREMRHLIRSVMDKDHAKDIATLVQRLVKDPKRLPEVVLDQAKEIHALENAGLDKEFGAKIAIVKAEESQDNKARQALPGRAAIMIR